MRPSLFLLGCLALASLCALTLGCPAPAQNPNGSYKESGAAHVYSPEENRIRAKVGEEFALRLPSNPTTGYTWMLRDDSVPDGLEFLGCKYKRTPADSGHDTPLVGSGGFDTWGFRASSPKTVTLELQKVRPWMKPRPETMDATFTITIE